MTGDRTIRMNICTVHVTVPCPREIMGVVRTEYDDGEVSEMRPSSCRVDRDLAYDSGYGTNVASYGIHYRMTLHWIAHVMGAQTSRTVWYDAHGGWAQAIAEEWKPGDRAEALVGFPWRCQDEAHLATAMLAWRRTGKPDPLKRVQALWSVEDIKLLLTDLNGFLDPWMKIDRSTPTPMLTRAPPTLYAVWPNKAQPKVQP